MTKSKGTIYYLGFYDLVTAKHKRNYAVAATSKMDYIASAVVNAGYAVHVISPSWIIDDKYVFGKGKTINIDNDIKLTLLPSFGSKTKIGTGIKIIFSLFCVFLKLLKLKKHDTLLVYHTPWLSIPVRWAKGIKGFRLILEVEEIYADITSQGKYFDKMEYSLIKSADAYLFSTDILKDKISSDKPSVVIYGRYNVDPTLNHPGNDKIRLLYAGIIDKKKAGAFNALYAAEYLSGDYELHIIGFGETKLLRDEIEKANKTNECKTYYNGILNGKDYIAFCQTCHIGLATQAMTGKYLESSFPSKILSYLSMGLNVVSGRIKCVEQSSIGNLVTYYDNDTPEDIAQAISNYTRWEPDTLREKITSIHLQFIDRMKGLLQRKAT